MAALSTYYFDHGKFEEARSLLDELKSENAGHGGARLLEARFLIKEGKFRDSLAILQVLNKDFPDWSEPLFYLGMAHYSLGQIDLAQQPVSSAIQKNPKNSEYRTLMAQMFLAKGAFEDAQKEATAALRLNLKNLQSALILSRALIGMKQYEKAVALLTEMRRQVPNDIKILSNLALASLGVNDHEKSEAYLTEILNLDPAHIHTLNLLIGLKYKGDTSGAESFVRQQIIKAEDSPGLYLLLGGLLEKQEKNEAALAAYEKAQELSPENTASLLASSRLLVRLGKNNEAMAKCLEIIEKDPNSIPAQMGIAALFEAEGNANKAIDQYNKVLEIRENYAPAANNLAWLIASEPGGDLGKALMLAMTAKQALPDDPSVADTLGWVHYKRGSYSLAISQFESALQIQPENPIFPYHLALAQRENNMKEDAILILEKLLTNKREFVYRKEAEELLSDLVK